MKQLLKITQIAYDALAAEFPDGDFWTEVSFSKNEGDVSIQIGNRWTMRMMAMRKEA
jgi:hypothetical protein